MKYSINLETYNEMIQNYTACPQLHTRQGNKVLHLSIFIQFDPKVKITKHDYHKIQRSNIHSEMNSLIRRS